MVDIITFILSILFLIRGASRGFMRSLLVPSSIIVATIISIIYYQGTGNLITSLILGLIGPLFLNLLFKSLLPSESAKLAIITDTKIKLSFFSRLGGSILTLIWGWVFIIFTLILFTVLPPWGETLTAIHNDVGNSASYGYIAKPLEEIFFAAPKQNNDAKSLAEDPRFQKILQDPDIQKEIDAHDIVKLMKNPKMMDLVQQLMSDPATMKKVFALYGSQAQPEKRSLANAELRKDAVQ